MMERLLPFSVLLLAHNILAQDIVTLESSLPQCAASCVQEGTAITGCAISDFACHCANYNTMASTVGPCLQQTQACTPDILTSMHATINQICAYYGELPTDAAAPPTPESAITTPVVAPAPAAETPIASSSSPTFSPSSSIPAALPDVANFLPTAPPPSPSIPAPANAIPSAPGGAPGGAPVVSPSPTGLVGTGVAAAAAGMVQKGMTTLSVVASPTPTGFRQGGDGEIGAAGRGRGVSGLLLGLVGVVVGGLICLA